MNRAVWSQSDVSVPASFQDLLSREVFGQDFERILGNFGLAHWSWAIKQDCVVG